MFKGYICILKLIFKEILEILEITNLCDLETSKNLILLYHLFLSSFRFGRRVLFFIFVQSCILKSFSAATATANAASTTNTTYWLKMHTHH